METRGHVTSARMSMWIDRGSNKGLRMLLIKQDHIVLAPPTLLSRSSDFWLLSCADQVRDKSAYRNSFGGSLSASLPGYVKHAGLSPLLMKAEQFIKIIVEQGWGKKVKERFSVISFLPLNHQKWRRATMWGEVWWVAIQLWSVMVISAKSEQVFGPRVSNRRQA